MLGDVAIHAGRPFFPGDIIRALHEAPGNRLLVTTPVHLRALVEACAADPRLCPPLLAGIVSAGELQAEAFRNFTLHIVLETLPNQPRAYGPQDAPRFGDKRGPYCGRLPNPPWSQSNPVTHLPDIDDGVDEPTGKGTSRAGGGGWFGSGGGFAGTPSEAKLLKGLLGPVLGSTAEDVPDLGVLLVGPMARGAEVSLR
mgnify:CR=1 FL=1